MKKLLVVAAVLLLTIALASCGGGSSSVTPPSVNGGGNGGYSNSSLNGTWVYSVRGSGNSSDLVVLGIFTADGNGHVTSGAQDVNDSAAGYTANTPVTGTYSVSQDGRGQVQLNFSGGTALFRFVLTSGSSARLFEVSNIEDATGQMFKQDSTAISNLAGTYVLRLDGFFGGSVDSVVGQISASGGPANGTLNATLDENFSGSVTQQQSAAGNFTMSSNGKGTANLAGPAGTFNFVYYIIDRNHAEFLETDNGGIVLGTAEMQSSGFSNAALNGPFVFSVGGLADNGTLVQAISEVGKIQFNGSGTIPAGFEAFNFGGNFQENVGFTGTYKVDASGRFTLQLAFSNGTSNYIGWLTSSQAGVLMSADSSSVESGSIRLQTGSPSTSTLKGNYGLAYSGPNYANNYQVQLTSALVLNGSGGITGVQDYQAGGVLTANSNVSGNYSIDANGVASGTVGGVPFRMFVADSSTAYFLSADAQRGYAGVMMAQQ